MLPLEFIAEKGEEGEGEDGGKRGDGVGEQDG